MLAAIKQFILTVFAIVVAGGFLVFAIVNREVVHLSLAPYPFEIETRLFVLVGLLLLSGSILGWFVSNFECRRRYQLQRSTRERLAALENENAALRLQQQRPDTRGVPARKPD